MMTHKHKNTIAFVHKTRPELPIDADHNARSFGGWTEKESDRRKLQRCFLFKINANNEWVNYNCLDRCLCCCVDPQPLPPPPARTCSSAPGSQTRTTTFARCTGSHSYVSGLSILFCAIRICQKNSLQLEINFLIIKYVKKGGRHS